MGHQFKAYDARGVLLMHTYTLSPCTFAAERAAYQSRLNKGDFAYVQVIDNDDDIEILHGRFNRPRISHVTYAR